MEEEYRYTKQSEVEDYLQRELTDYEKGFLHILIASASSFINNYTRRSFPNIDSEDDEIEDTTLIFDGVYGRELFIHDTTEVTSVKFLDSQGNVTETLSESDYVLYPLNTAWKNSIYLRSGRFPTWRASVEVTGKFTFGVLPAEVIQATTALVAQAIARAKADGSEFERESIEGYSYWRRGSSGNTRYDVEVAPILALVDRWRKISF